MDGVIFKFLVVLVKLFCFIILINNCRLFSIVNFLFLFFFNCYFNVLVVLYNMGILKGGKNV